MDLVANYDSDSSGSPADEDAIPEPAPLAQSAPALPSWATTTAKREQPSGLLDDLPAPSGQPKRKKRRTLPMTIQYVPDSDDEVSKPYKFYQERCFAS